MKKIFGFILISFFIAACGQSEVCECVETGLNMMKEAEKAGMDAQKLKEIEEEYRPKLEECEKIDEGKSDAEREAMEKELKNCPAFKEMEELQKQRMQR